MHHIIMYQINILLLLTKIYYGIDNVTNKLINFIRISQYLAEI